MHIIKLHSADVKAVLGEARREHESKVGSIDPEKTKDNYNLARRLEWDADLLKNRIKDLGVKRKVKDDAVLACSCIVTLPKDYQGDPEAFFKSATKALCHILCGGDTARIVQAEVHMDEKTPHMHFSWVPIVEKDGKRKLSAKEQLTKSFLTTFHSAVEQYMTADLGMEILLHDEEKCAERAEKRSKGDFSADYVSLEEYKATKEKEAYITDLEAQIDTLKEECVEGRNLLHKYRNENNRLQEENNRLQEEITQKSTIVESLNRYLIEIAGRWLNAYKAIQKRLDHFFNEERDTYKSLVEAMDPVVKKYNTAHQKVDSMLNKRTEPLIFGSVTSAVSDMESATSALERLADGEEEDYEM